MQKGELSLASSEKVYVISPKLITMGRVGSHHFVLSLVEELGHSERKWGLCTEAGEILGDEESIYGGLPPHSNDTPVFSP